MQNQSSETKISNNELERICLEIAGSLVRHEAQHKCRGMKPEALRRETLKWFNYRYCDNNNPNSSNPYSEELFETALWTLEDRKVVELHKIQKDYGIGSIQWGIHLLIPTNQYEYRLAPLKLQKQIQ